MTLIKSISGIRGTIGGRTGDTLNPLDIVKFTTAYATFIKKAPSGAVGGAKIVVGRDGRISGPMVRDVVCGTLVGMGYEVIDIGLATTPTTELAVRWHHAQGGIIITASHNPTQWNALKLLNSEGEFLTAEEGAEVLRIAEAEDFDYAPVEQLGRVITDDTMNQRHVESVLGLRLCDVEAIRRRHFRVCADTTCRASWSVCARAVSIWASSSTPMWTASPSSARTDTCSARNTRWSAWPTMC